MRLARVKAWRFFWLRSMTDGSMGRGFAWRSVVVSFEFGSSSDSDSEVSDSVEVVAIEAGRVRCWNARSETDSLLVAEETSKGC